MYCICCGKRIGDDFPICESCAALVLAERQQEAQANLLAKVQEQAKSFVANNEGCDRPLEEAKDSLLQKETNKTSVDDIEVVLFVSLITFVILILLLGIVQYIV